MKASFLQNRVRYICAVCVHSNVKNDVRENTWMYRILSNNVIQYQWLNYSQSHSRMTEKTIKSPKWKNTAINVICSVNSVKKKLSPPSIFCLTWRLLYSGYSFGKISQALQFNTLEVVFFRSLSRYFWPFELEKWHLFVLFIYLFALESEWMDEMGSITKNKSERFSEILLNHPFF